MTRLALAALLGTALAEPNTCNPAPSQYPIFHVIGNNADGSVYPINDASGILLYKGVYHVFHQCCQNHWDHIVSTDLVHWKRLPSPVHPDQG